MFKGDLGGLKRVSGDIRKKIHEVLWGHKGVLGSIKAFHEDSGAFQKILGYFIRSQGVSDSYRAVSVYR